MFYKHNKIPNHTVRRKQRVINFSFMLNVFVFYIKLLSFLKCSMARNLSCLPCYVAENDTDEYHSSSDLDDENIPK